MHVRHCGTPALWGRSLTVTVNTWWEFVMKPVCFAPPPASGTGSLTPRQLVDREKTTFGMVLFLELKSQQADLLALVLPAVTVAMSWGPQNMC